MQAVAIALGVLVVAIIAAALIWRIAAGRMQLPCPSQFTWMLENPYVHAVAGAETLIDRAGVQEGMAALDIGCGPGRVTIPAARRVGPKGKVIALDMQAAMIEKTRKRALEEGLDNIDFVLHSVAGGLLPDDVGDRAFLITVLGEIPDKAMALRVIYRALKPGGILSVTEMLPDPHYQSRAAVIRLAREAGFEVGEFFGNVIAFTQNLRKPRETA